VRSGSLWDIEHRFRGGDGRWYDILARGVPVRNERGEITHWAGINLDISGLKRAENALHEVNESLEALVAQRTAEAESRAQALAESERFAHATIDALDSALCVLDGRGIIIAVNQAWRDFAIENGGQPDKLCEGSSYLAACDAATASFPVAAAVARAIREALAGKRQDFSIEYDCHSPAERRWFIMNLSCFPGEGPLRLVIKHENITARKLAEEDQRESANRLKQLAAHLETVREKQSATIAREVHDELGGTLTMVKLGLATVAADLPEAGAANESLGRILKLVDVALQTVKRISADLRPATLDTLGLVATIRWYAAQFSAVTGIETVLQLPQYVDVSKRQGTAIFRIIQEALTNVAKHAEASQVCIAMRRSRGQWMIKITDDGVGLTGAHQNKKNSFGLIGMHERASNLGGLLSISGRPGEGTCLNLRIPVDDPNTGNGE
jgi:signal transduction histidine kinase